MIFVVGCIFSQNSTSFSNTLSFKSNLFTLITASQKKRIEKPNITDYKKYFSNSRFLLDAPQMPFSIINPNFYTQNFGFFCKQELHFENVTKIPLKFRLGSVQQCDWLEGKSYVGIK